MLSRGCKTFSLLSTEAKNTGERPVFDIPRLLPTIYHLVPTAARGVAGDRQWRSTAPRLAARRLLAPRPRSPAASLAAAYRHCPPGLGGPVPGGPRLDCVRGVVNFATSASFSRLAWRDIPWAALLCKRAAPGAGGIGTGVML